jgi:hypothetical protein
MLDLVEGASVRAALIITAAVLAWKVFWAIARAM